MLLLVKKRQALLDKEEIERFSKCYGTFFEEFKEEGLSNWLFYVLFIFRRIAMIFCISFVQNPILQLSIYFSFAISVLFI